jgi:hypothetical protein
MYNLDLGTTFSSCYFTGRRIPVGKFSLIFCQQLLIILAFVNITVLAYFVGEITVLTLTNTAIVGSNPTRDVDVCLHLFCVCVVKFR